MKIFNVLLVLHIIGGSVGLLTGTYILLIKKGDKKHKLFGNIYFYALLCSSLLAFPMSYLHPNYFLFIVGVFTAFMLLSGKRYLRIKTQQDVKFSDWLLSAIMFVFGLLFIGFGVYNLINSNTFGVVMIVFGLIGLDFVRQDCMNFKGKSKTKNFFLTTHLQRMMGSFIASATAFLVVNNTFFPSVLAWLLPTIIITPLIIKWSRQYTVIKNDTNL